MTQEELDLRHNQAKPPVIAMTPTGLIDTKASVEPVEEQPFCALCEEYKISPGHYGKCLTHSKPAVSDEDIEKLAKVKVKGFYQSKETIKPFTKGFIEGYKQAVQNKT